MQLQSSIYSGSCWLLRLLMFCPWHDMWYGSNDSRDLFVGEWTDQPNSSVKTTTKFLTFRCIMQTKWLHFKRKQSFSFLPKYLLMCDHFVMLVLFTKPLKNNTSGDGSQNSLHFCRFKVAKVIITRKILWLLIKISK